MEYLLLKKAIEDHTKLKSAFAKIINLNRWVIIKKTIRMFFCIAKPNKAYQYTLLLEIAINQSRFVIMDEIEGQNATTNQSN